MSLVTRFKKGVHLLKCKALGRPLDPELQQNLHELNLRLRFWGSLVNRKSLDHRLHHEFNLWAEKGIGEGMDHAHLRIIEQALPKMDLVSGDRVLDLACGAGLASCLIAKTEPYCRAVIGMDISDEMLRHARDRNRIFGNMEFVCGSAQRLPFPDNAFTKILSVEAFYYFEDQERVLAELFRTAAPHGRLFLLICLYREHVDSLSTVDDVAMPVHVRSIDEYLSMLRKAGWTDAHAEEFVRVRQPGQKPDVHDRALLLTGRKSGLARQVPKTDGFQEGALFQSHA